MKESIWADHALLTKSLKKMHNKIKELLDKNVSKAEIARLMDCTWSTLHRYINESILNSD
jgi:DNA invertase Pin-like site-specific DNA recombinase